jgi:hypothetical protein
MVTKTWTGSANTTWDALGNDNWSPLGFPTAGDDIVFPANFGTVTLSTSNPPTSAFASLLIPTGTTLAISTDALNINYTAASAVTVDSGGAITIAGGALNTGTTGGIIDNGAVNGFGTLNGSTSGAGTITALGGPLEITGTVTGINLAVGDSSTVLPLDSAATTRLTLDGAGNSATSLTFLGTEGIFQVASGANLTVTNAIAIGVNVIKLLGTGVQLTDSNGITLAPGGFLEGDGTVSNTTNVTGAGRVSIDFYAGVGGTITASGGTLELTGNVSGRTLAIDTTSPSDLKIFGRTTAATFTINNANQTLEIGDDGNLTLTGGTQTVSNGTIKLDFGTGTLTASGITLGSSGSDGFIVGAGTINSTVSHGGFGTGSSITAFGGMLEITGAVTDINTLKVGRNATMKLDGAGSSATAVTFSNTGGTLEITNGAGLAVTNAIAVGVNTIKLDGTNATLTDGNGIVLAPGGFITGSGIIDANTAVGGTGGTIIASGGVLEFKGAVDAANLTFQIDNTPGSDLKFDSSVSTTGTTPTIMFDGTNSGQGILDLTAEGQLGNFNGQVANFAVGDEILVSGTNGDSVHLAGPNELEIINNNVVIETINLVGDYTGAHFGSSNSGGIDTITTDAICFYPGTFVRTPNGEVAVDTLRRGDLVLTSEGVAKPVQWLGRQTISTVFADPLRVWPIRIKAGALGENVPSRDLRLSPDHAVLVDGALIQASALVNGTSIVRETTVPRVFVYYHIELEDHSLVLAENTPAETFIDNVDRLAFDNWDEHEALYPNGKPIEELPHPRAKAHRQVPMAMRTRLAERAQVISAVSGTAAA